MLVIRWYSRSFLSTKTFEEGHASHFAFYLPRAHCLEGLEFPQMRTNGHSRLVPNWLVSSALLVRHFKKRGTAASITKPFWV